MLLSVKIEYFVESFSNNCIDEKDKNNHLEFGCKGDDPTPYEVSFDNSQFTTEIKSGPTDTNLEVVVEGKKNE